MEWHAGMRETQTRLDQWWDKVTGRDNLKAQIEDLQEHSEATASEIIDLNYEILNYEVTVRQLALQGESRMSSETLALLKELVMERGLDQVVQEAAANRDQAPGQDLER